LNVNEKLGYEKFYQILNLEGISLSRLTLIG